ncbi:OsmC family protein [Mycoplana rhizolycopersici]|uniref:OsmC family protein n=1 Tax=Mycoplana rhizolycopersici TaxID=2746702 RepID=A0ABX2QHA5_9HYPH|nr:OsmC family protein [Rhizobium rhizolycopersici]NVP57171.1 OsmC family protein [Rhizobium rhizolycopersici]
MAEARMRERTTGATATIGRTGFPAIRSRTGGTLDIVTGANQAGFNPLDLLYASLSACLAMSARYVANRIGVLDRLTTIEVTVTGEKAEAGLARVQTFDIAFVIGGSIDAETRRAIVRAAEDEICTVSNTIRGNPQFRTTISD